MVRRPTITIDIDDGIARVVILEGREVVAWGTSVLGPEDVGEESEHPDGDAGVELHTLLKHLPYQDGRVVISLPPRTCLIRRLELPKMNRRYLEQVILAEVLEAIPLNEVEADIAWQHRKYGPGHDVVAVAAPKSAIDRQVAMLNGSGCRAAAAYPRALALAFAAGCPDAIVVDLGLFSAVVVAVHGGIPLLVHQVEYPDNNCDPRQRAEAIARTVEQAADQFHTMDGKTVVGTEEAELPAVMTGQLADDPALVESIEALTGREAMPYSPRFVYPEHFPVREYAANLGLALADQSRPRARARSSANATACVNALPDRHKPPTLPILPAAVLVLVIVLGYLAFVATGRVDNVTSEREALSSQIATVQRQARSHNLSLAKGATIEKHIEEATRMQLALENQLLALNTRIDTLATQLISISEGALSTETRLLTLLLRGRTFLLTGTATGYEGAVRFAEQLRGSRLFDDVRVLRVDGSGGEGVSGAATGPGAGSVSYQIEVSVPQGPEES